MRSRNLPWVLVVLVTTAAATATAQTEGDGTIWAEPDEMTIDPRKHIQRGGQEPERQSFDVHVQAEIQCPPLTAAPVLMFVEAAGTGRLMEQTEGTIYFDYAPRNFTIEWTAAGGGTFTIDHVETITVISNGAPPGDGLTATIRWNTAQAEFEGTPRCDPRGYAWIIEGENQTVRVPGTGNFQTGTDTGTGTGNESTPVPAMIPVMAIATAAALARRRSS